MSANRKPRLRCGILTKLAVTIGVIGILGWQLVTSTDATTVVLQFTPGYLALAIAVLTFDRVLMTFNWTRLLRSQRLHLPLWRGTRIYCASMIWGLVLPVTIGADLVRSFATIRAGLPGASVFASIVVERILGFFASLLVALGGLALLASTRNLDDRFGPVWWLGAAALTGGTVLFGLSFNRSFFSHLERCLPKRLRSSRAIAILHRLQTAYHAYAQHKPVLATFLVLSVVKQLTAIAFAWCVALALGINVPWIYVAGALPVAMLVARLPVSISGLGVFDGVFALLLSLGGTTLVEAIAITVAYRIVEIIGLTPWWVAYVFSAGSVRAPRDAAVPEPNAVR